MALKTTAAERRENRVRRTLRQQRERGKGRVRLTVHRSGQHIYAQVIDDVKGVTLAAASSVEKGLRAASGATKTAAQAVGKLVAERAREKGVDVVVFDRGRFLYHGRIKELADAAREAGLQF